MNLVRKISLIFALPLILINSASHSSSDIFYEYSKAKEKIEPLVLLDNESFKFYEVKVDDKHGYNIYVIYNDEYNVLSTPYKNKVSIMKYREEKIPYGLIAEMETEPDSIKTVHGSDVCVYISLPSSYYIIVRLSGVYYSITGQLSDIKEVLSIEEKCMF